MVEAIVNELIIRKTENVLPIASVYLGGGTPSILNEAELQYIFSTIKAHYQLEDNVEITLEANPDDLIQGGATILEFYRDLGINRLSIGVQSFDEEDLKLMNRAHNASDALKCLAMAQDYFDNITIDLIYGIPEMSLARWEANINRALQFNVNHISSYALTVEENTALAHFIEKGKIPPVEDELAHSHFEVLVATLEKHGFVHYELSNFGKRNYFSKHNSSYWKGKSYLGIGPSAHSFNGAERSWNVANNKQYINALQQGQLPSEQEELTLNDRFNEYMMTGLRTIWGVSLSKVREDYGTSYLNILIKNSSKFVKEGLLEIDEEKQLLKTTAKGKFLCDGLASDLFIV